MASPAWLPQDPQLVSQVPASSSTSVPSPPSPDLSSTPSTPTQVPAASFSYGLHQNVNASVNSQQPLPHPAMKSNLPVIPMAVQPRVPGLPSHDAPLFSYNVSQQSAAAFSSNQHTHPSTDATKTKTRVLACTDKAVLSVSQVFEAMRELGNEGVEQYDPLVFTSASSLRKLPVESSSVDTVILIWQSLDCPTNQLVQEVLRVLKVGGTTLVLKSSQSAASSLEKIISDIESRLLVAGFSQTQVLSSGLKSLPGKLGRLLH